MVMTKKLNTKFPFGTLFKGVDGEVFVFAEGVAGVLNCVRVLDHRRQDDLPIRFHLRRRVEELNERKHRVGETVVMCVCFRPDEKYTCRRRGGDVARSAKQNLKFLQNTYN